MRGGGQTVVKQDVGAVDFQAPRHIAALGVPESMVLDMVLRRALLDGHTSTMQLATSLAVTPFLMESAVEHLRRAGNDVPLSRQDLEDVPSLEGLARSPQVLRGRKRTP